MKFIRKTLIKCYKRFMLVVMSDKLLRKLIPINHWITLITISIMHCPESKALK